MKIAVLASQDLGTLSGGYLYDRMLVRHLEAQGDDVVVVYLPRTIEWEPKERALEASLRAWRGAEVVVEDEIDHRLLTTFNQWLERAGGPPAVCIVHHLAWEAERNPIKAAEQRTSEGRFLSTVDGFIFNSYSTQASVETICPRATGVVARPGKDHIDPCDHIPCQGTMFTVLYLGNVTPHKGVDVLVRAVSTLPLGSVRLVIAGSTVDQRYHDYLIRLIGRLDLEKAVTMRGRVDNGERDRLFRSCHVLALPSFHEGYGLVAVEAMAYGLPVIAPSSGGAKEVFENGREGFIVEGGDLQGLASRLALLSNDRDLLHRMGRRAREKYDALPTWDDEMRRARAYLHEVASSTLTLESY